MYRNFYIVSFYCFLLLGTGGLTKAQSRESETKELKIDFSASGDAFALAGSQGVADLVYSSSEDPGIIRAIGDLQKDIQNVTSQSPLLVNKLSGKKPEVLIGSLGNKLIEGIIKKEKIDVSPIRGQWEAFMITTAKGKNGMDMLCIIGSDKRGTLYGIYELSAKIGVSPWYWWADVPVKKHPELYVSPQLVVDRPGVKYRGIFLNDEAPALTGWVNEKFGGFNHKFYEHVFELILRLKGNFLWPAMWGSAFYDDDPENPKLADEYGVVIGTSHHEPLMRAHAEWAKYGEGPWDYTRNKDMLETFWRNSIRERKDYEALITVGMRGDGDEAMTEGTAIDLLQKIITDQRQILKEETGKKPHEIPQVWALYKEVQDYYNKGMRVPEDITLLLCDDNWGNVRVLPKPGSPARTGGYGMYYHFDFVGGPVSYRWLNVSPISRTWEQMNLSYEHGVDRLWIVNVGDLKPMEFPISFFLDHAWDPEGMTAEAMGKYTEKWAADNFGTEHATEIARLISTYSRFNYRRTPEMLSPSTYSLKDYREFQGVVEEYNDLLKSAKAVAGDLPDEYQSAFYQLVLHPIEACANLNEMYYVAGLNRLYATQGRASTNQMAEKVAALFTRDSLISEYYHKDLADGKWNHFMSQTHIGYTSWNNPPVNYMPEVKTLEVPDKASLGIMPEGSLSSWPGAEGRARLPEFDKLNQQEFYIELFNRGKRSADFVAVPSDPWINLSEQHGTIEEDERILVSINWDDAPDGRSSGFIMLTSGSGEEVKIDVSVLKNPALDDLEFEGFVEANGYISMEAEHYSNKMETNDLRWLKIPEFGRTLSGMTVFPTTHAPLSPGAEDSPRLEYDVFVDSPGEVTVKVYIAPTLNIYNDEGMKYAASFDEDPLQLVRIHEGDTIPDWEYPEYWNLSVTNNTRVMETSHKLSVPGPHTLKLWVVTPGVVFEKIVIETKKIGGSYLGPPESFMLKD